MRAVFRDEIVAGVAGAAAIGLVEVVAIGAWRVGLIASVWAVLLGLGLVIGGVFAVQAWAIEKFRPRPLVAAAIHAAGGAIALIPLGSRLFDGGFAATLPGASLAPVWVPVVGVAALVAAIWSGARLVDGVGAVSPRVGRAAVAAALVVLIIAFELANRRLFRSEYPAVHAFLVVCSCSAAAVLVRLVAGGGRLRSRRRVMWRVGVSATVTIAVIVALFAGLRDPQDRWLVAERGTHSLYSTRMARAMLDFDGDGYAAVLGGGDCDEGNPSINRGAADIPLNRIDEDCDGVDGAAVLKHADALSPEERQRYLSSEGASALRERARDAPVILISIDALRADQLEPTDANRAEFPRLFELLDDSVRFSNAYAVASGTDVSLSSLVTGRVDPFVPVRATMLEAIADAGRESHGVLPREVLRWAPRTLLTGGIDSVSNIVNDPAQRDVGGETTSVQVTTRALAFVDKMARREPPSPFLLWVHYFDVHEHAQVEVTDRDLRSVATPDELSSVTGKYRALLRLTDREIGRLLDGLAERGVLDDAVIVLFSDHGESLGEDPRLPTHHGMYVYNALTRVPLAIRAPGAAPRHVAEAVSLLDVFPTLVDLLSLPSPGRLDGSSLFLHLLPDAPPEPLEPGRALVLNESDQWGVVVWPYKLMVRPADNLVELYDLEADPGERQNLVADEPRIASLLRTRYHAFPKVSFDRTAAGRRWREQQSRRPRRQRTR